MPDVLTPEQRRLNMERIRGKDTTPELKIRRLLRERGIRGYRIHYDLPGKPDIVFVRKKIAIFIDGCFWHKCPVCFTEPETRKDFWLDKINRNVARDRKINEELLSLGWKVLRFWEHDIKKDPESVLKIIIDEIQD